MGEKKKMSEAELAEKHKEDKKRKKEQKELAERLKIEREEQAIADEKVKLIYESGLSDAYRYFLSEAYKEDVKFNIFEYAAQKILKFEKIRREKNKKISELEKNINKKEEETVELEEKSKDKLKEKKSLKKLLKPEASQEKKKKEKQSLPKE